MPARVHTTAALVTGACVSFAFWISNGTLAIVSGRAHEWIRLALLPSVGLLAAAAIAALALLLSAKRAGGHAILLAGSLLLLLPWLPLPLPAAALTWSGGSRFWIWAATVIAWWATRPALPNWWRLAVPFQDRRRAPWIAGVVAFALYAGGFAAVSPRLPGGDEPHYLVITQSLLRDHDLQIENNHRRGDYREYFDGDLRPDYLRRGRNGQIYSIHAPGLAALVAPAYAVGGYRGVILFLAALAAITSVLVWILAIRLTSSVSAAWFAWAAACLTTPFFFHAFVVYPDPVGAAIVVLALTLLVGRAVDRASNVTLAAYGAALALLPWLHSRYAVLAAALGFVILARLAARPKWIAAAVAFLAIPVVSAIAWFSFFYAIYGTANPAAPYGTYTQTALSEIPRGLSGFLIDQQFGLVPNAPVLACVVVGWAALFRRDRRLAIELALVVSAYAVVAASYHMWWAGASSPARFVIAVVPALGLPLAAFFADARPRARWLAAGALAASLGITAALALVHRGGLLYQDRDGISLWLEWVAPLVDVPHGLPSLFRGTLATAWRDAGIWALCTAGAAALAAGADARFGRLAGALTALLAIPAAAAIALTLVWRLWGVTPITPTSAQLALLDSYRPGARGLVYDPLRLAPADEVVTSVRLESSTRRTFPGDQPLVVLRDVPAGRYAVDLDLLGGTATPVQVDAGRTTIDWWSEQPGMGRTRHEISLPVRVMSLFVRTEPAARPLVMAASLRPLALAPPEGPLAGLTARSAMRYPTATVYYIGGPADVEPGGIWIRPGRDAVLAIAPVSAVSSLQITVGTGPIANRCDVEMEGWRQAIALAPGEQQPVTLPLRPGSVGALIRTRAAAGFVPADVDPSSTDRRTLGCRVEFPE